MHLKLFKKATFFSFLLILLTVSFAFSIEPVVQTDWLEKNLNNQGIVIVDVRKPEEYKAGHIPNSVNVFYGSWAITKNSNRNELPALDDLIDLIGSAGITADSHVIVVSKTDAPPDKFDMTRVLWTLKYAGVKNVSMLDGGYNKWVVDKRAISTEPVKPKSKTFKAALNKHLIVDKNYVMSRLGKAILVDVREPEFFQGKKKLDFVAKAGHIKGAVNLPNSLAFNKDSTFKTKEELEKSAVSAVGSDKTKEIITYCDTGKTCTAWAIILSDMLGYKDVKIYDGSAEEWTKDQDAPWE
ncbi:MAG TPA: sulfurtransferase [Syntrophorhabdaceae bacterium]|nr:sulfurtransferase [Syntrophorhabdaceae bacterium]